MQAGPEYPGGTGAPLFLLRWEEGRERVLDKRQKTGDFGLIPAGDRPVGGRAVVEKDRPKIPVPGDEIQVEIQEFMWVFLRISASSRP